MTQKGKLIVIDGIDGTGKATQLDLLNARLREEGFRVGTFDFPQYEKESSFFVRQYLNGAYGDLKDVHPKKASLFYALDRFDVAPFILQMIQDGMIVTSNRYVSANMGHQGAKYVTMEELIEYFEWVIEMEYGILNIPRPDVSVILHLPAVYAQELIERKGKRKYLGDKVRDIHEDNLEYLQSSERVYLKMIELFPKDFRLVECMEENRLLTPKEVHERIWEAITPVLKKISKRP